jgi:hypothetical protein
MTFSQGQFGLFPECGYQCWAALHGTQSASGEVTDLSERAGTEVADLLGLQITPEVFHRIEFWGISRQERKLDVHIVPFDILAHDFALMRLQTVPDNQQGAGDLPGERGKFFKPDAQLNLPVYLDDEVRAYLQRQAAAKGKELNEIVNEMLKKDIDLVAAVK